MSNINPQGVDLITGKSRPIATGDVLTDSAGNPLDETYPIAPSTGTATNTGTNGLAIGAGAVNHQNNSLVLGPGASLTDAGNNPAAQPNLLIGNNSSLVTDSSSGSNVVIGPDCSLITGTGGANTLIGSSITAVGRTNATLLGWATAASGDQSIAIGGQAQAAQSAIAIGIQTVAPANHFVVGSPNGGVGGISNVFFGNGTTNSTPQSVTINATGGSGANIVGADLNLASGISTGLAVSGNINFRYAPAGVSGVIPNTLLTTVTISGADGSISCPGTGTSSERFGAGASTGDSYSTAIGNSAVTSGASSTAVGESATAALNSTTVGQAASSSGANACAFGSNSTADANGSVCLGSGANSSIAASNAIVIGGATFSTASQTVTIGAGASTTGGNAVAVGQGSQATTNSAIAFGVSSTSSGIASMALGASATAAFDYSIALGFGATTTAIAQLVIGGNSVPNETITDIYFGNGVQSSLASNGYTLHATGGVNPGQTGGQLALAGGLAGDLATGGGSIALKTAQTTNGTNLVNRTIVNSVAKTLTSATPVGIISVNVPTGTLAGGQIRCTVRATDGTDYQVLSGVIYWTALNQTGTAQGDASASTFSSIETTGTLTLAADTNVSGSTVTVRATATTSLTPTTFDLQYQVENNSTQDITIL